MKYERNLDNYDAAIVSYVNACLNGRSLRFQKHSDAIVTHEIPLLNEPQYEEEYSEERIEKISRPNETPLDTVVLNKIILEQALHSLTPKEAKIINELFWKDKSIKTLCNELHVSKNAIHKMKRNALQKLQRILAGTA